VISCAEARSQLLVAAPAELEGGDGSLAEHLGGCPECRRAADLVLAATREVAAGLAGAATRLEPGEAARRAAAVARPRPTRVGWRRVARWAPLAAAAAVVVALWGRDEPFAPPAQPIGAGPALEVDVLAGGSRPAAVFRTADPNIVVIWFF
jgi:hypothetical protein